MSEATLTNESTRSRHSAWLKRSQWLSLATVVLAVIAMAVTSPPMSGPDEPAHQATAGYLTVHILPPTQESREYVPGIAKYDSCTAFNAEQDASCSPTREDVSAALIRVFNYPPPYYWVVGLGQKFAPEADTWMDVGGRAASVVLNLAGLLLLALLIRRHSGQWGTYVLLMATPMAVFLWGVVNPNGWEITSGLLFAYFFARAWWVSDGTLGASEGWKSWLPVAAAAIAFALSRHDAIVWMCLVVIATLLMGRRGGNAIHKLKALAAVGVGLLAGLAWQFTHPAQHVGNNPNPVADPTLRDYIGWITEIDEFLPVRLRQMVGVLGWLDTPVPQWMFFALLLGWAALIGFLYARTRISLWVAVIGFVGTVIVPSFLEVLRWNDWPYWYQGRITLAFTLPFLLLVLLRFGRFGKRPAELLSLATEFVLLFMVWLNFSRYQFGVSDYLPLRWSDPAMPGLPFWAGLALMTVMAIALLIKVGVYVSPLRWDRDEFSDR